MERLTNKETAEALKNNYEKLMEAGADRDISQERYIKLAAYENTGLEPEEVEELQRQLKEKEDKNENSKN